MKVLLLLIIVIMAVSPILLSHSSPAVLKLQYGKFKEASGCNFIITSGHRSIEHNKLVGGAVRSFHLKGEAYDIVPLKTCSKSRYKLYTLAKEYFNGVILYKSHIHVDVGDRIYYSNRRK